MKSIYFLFGQEVCELYDELEDKSVFISTIENEGIDFDLFEYNEDTTPIELLDAFVGWNDYMIITEKEFNLLNTIKEQWAEKDIHI